MRHRWPFITLIFLACLPLLTGIALMLMGWEAELNKANVRMFRLSEKPKSYPTRYQAIGMHFSGTNAFRIYWFDRTVAR